MGFDLLDLLVLHELPDLDLFVLNDLNDRLEHDLRVDSRAVEQHTPCCVFHYDGGRRVAQIVLEHYDVMAQVDRRVTKSNVHESSAPSDSRVHALNRELYAELCASSSRRWTRVSNRRH